VILNRFSDLYLLDRCICRNRKIFARDESEVPLGINLLTHDALTDGVDPSGSWVSVDQLVRRLAVVIPSIGGIF